MDQIAWGFRPFIIQIVNSVKKVMFWLGMTQQRTMLNMLYLVLLTRTTNTSSGGCTARFIQHKHVYLFKVGKEV